MSLWLSQHGVDGVLAEGTVSLANAEQHIRHKWYHGICQSSATKISFFMDNMGFDSDVTASYLRGIRPSASIVFSHIMHQVQIRWLRPQPQPQPPPQKPREQRVCRHRCHQSCSMQAVEKMSNTFFLTALFKASLEVSNFRFGTHYIHLWCVCVFKPGCLMCHNWPD